MALSIAEVRDWERFAVEYPFPNELIDVHMAMVASVIANCNRGPTTPAFKVSEFMLLGRAAPQPEEDEAARVLKALAGG